MTSENIKIDELEEFKNTIRLMDEKLDTQEIVTPDQIRAATMEKVGLLETELKQLMILGCVVGFPLLTLFFHFNGGLSVPALWTAGISGFVFLIISLFLLRKVSRKSIVELDLNTLLTKERKYRRTYLIIMAVIMLYWTIYAYVFVSLTLGIIYTIMDALLFVPQYYQSFVRAYREGLQGKIDNKPTLYWRIGEIARLSMFALCILALTAFFVLNVIAFFKLNTDLNFKSIDWWTVLSPLMILGGIIGLVPLFIDQLRRKTHKIRPVSIVCFAISTVLFAGRFIFNYIKEGDTTIFTSLFPLLIAVWILYRAVKK